MRIASIFLLLSLTALGLTAAACSSSNQSENPDVIEKSGTVQYIDLEGGFYGIVADDGTKYDPSGLPEEYQQDGLRVSFTAQRREGVLTTRMWGQVIQLIEIERE